MQRGRGYPQSLDYWSEPDAPPTARRPLEVLLWQYKNGSNPSIVYDFSNSTGIFDPTTGTYAWLDTAIIGLNPYISTIIETIIGTSAGVRFDFDLQSPATGEAWHAHALTSARGYPWATTGTVYTMSVVDSDTFVGGISPIVQITPRRYY